MNDRSTTFALIGERYLDTQHSDEYIESLEKELKRRGVTGVKRWVFEYFAAAGLWWNILWWEWVDLDGKDILIGWIQNAVIFGIPSFIVGAMFGYVAAIACFLVLHLLTLKMGWELRAGTKLDAADKQEQD